MKIIFTLGVDVDRMVNAYSRIESVLDEVDGDILSVGQVDDEEAGRIRREQDTAAAAKIYEAMRQQAKAIMIRHLNGDAVPQEKVYDAMECLKPELLTWCGFEEVVL
jgi:hypothetical protein